MGFYMEDNNKIRVYINDAYIKTALLDNKRPSVKVIRDTSSELKIFKKLNITIPVIGINDLTDLLADDIKPETIDTNSTFLFLKKEPFLAFLYLLKEGRAYNNLKHDVLFGSSFNSRLDALLSFLNEREDTGIDIFGPLKNQLRRYSNYDNPFEKDATFKSSLRKAQSSTVIEPGYLNINYGNIYYIKNGNSSKASRELFSEVTFSDTLKNYPLPTTPDLAGLLYSGIGVDTVANNYKISDWEVIGYLVVSYALLAPIYALAMAFSWAAPKTLGTFLGHLSTSVFESAVNAGKIIGLSRMLSSYDIFTNFLAARKVARIDWIELDSIFNILSQGATFVFNNRLALTGKVFSKSERDISIIVSKSLKNNLVDRDNATNLFNNKFATEDAEEFSWYTNLLKKVKEYDSNATTTLTNASTLPISIPSEETEHTDGRGHLKISEYGMMLEPLSLFITTGDESTYLNNGWLATLLLRTNYAYLEHIHSRNIKEPKIFQDDKRYYLNFILNNDILMTRTSDDLVEIVNFGTSCFSKVVNEVIQYVEDKTESVTMDIERAQESINTIKNFLETLDVSKIQLPANEKPYLPLARVLIINYISWLLDDEKDEEDISEIFRFDDNTLWEIYVLSFFVRHSIYMLNTATNLVIKNESYKLLCNDPTGGNNALNALVDYISKFKNNVYANTFASYLTNNTTSIYNMMAGVTKKSYYS